jgi:hypothetical protein
MELLMASYSLHPHDLENRFRRMIKAQLDDVVDLQTADTVVASHSPLMRVPVSEPVTFTDLPAGVP